ncbi:MAG: carboxylating nicotinate-nucleotide diphosphorylase [bacterium]
MSEESPAEKALHDLVEAALAEDLGDGDITSEATVPEDARAHGRIVLKEPGSIYGFDAAEKAFLLAGAESFERLAPEGPWQHDAPVDVALVDGPARAILAGERVAMNLLCHLSGVATLTAIYLKAIEGVTGPNGEVPGILDTRKTMPGLRALEKAAVASVGGRNHRKGLYDEILIKENHAAMAGGIAPAVEQALAAQPEKAIEVEVRSEDEIREAIAAGARRLLLDNMDPETLTASVALAREAAGEECVELEASGGINLSTVAAVAATGVDEISIGALTHSAPALDLSLLVEIVEAEAVAEAESGQESTGGSDSPSE